VDGAPFGGTGEAIEVDLRGRRGDFSKDTQRGRGTGRRATASNLKGELKFDTFSQEFATRRRDFFTLSASAVTGTALGAATPLGVSLVPTLARAQEARIKRAKITPSVCPYCSVGCATLVHTVDGKIVNNREDRRIGRRIGG
jgi:hypothetical protein